MSQAVTSLYAVPDGGAVSEPYKDCESIMISQWPEFDEAMCYEREESEMSIIIEAIRSIRALRTEMNVPASRKAQLIVVTDSANRHIFEEAAPYFMRLASASGVKVQEDNSGIPADAAAAAVSIAKLFIPLEELIDFEKELARLEKEKANLENELKRVGGKLSNQGFVSKAPAAVIEEERAKQEKYQSMYDSVIQRIAQLKK